MVKDRMKATQIFNESSFPFGKKVSFEQAFPEIEDIDIVVVETEGGGIVDFDCVEYSPKRWRSTHKMGVGEYIDCHNSMCYSGGFSIGRIIKQMINDREEEKTGIAFCKRTEGSQKGKKRNRSCINDFRYKISIKFKE